MSLPTPVISAESLADRLDDPDLRIVDTRFSLTDTEAGRRDYLAGHVPGAIYMHLDEDLSGSLDDSTGRHPLPDPQDFARRLGRAGISDRHDVVIYDASGGAIAARLWWMLRWLGHDRVAVMDGGFPAWVAAGCPRSVVVPEARSAIFTGRPQNDMLVSSADVLDAVRGGGMILVDAREPARFQGREEPIDAVAGRIPGAVNFPWADNLRQDGRMLSSVDLRRRWEKRLGAVCQAKLVCMCGSGVTACLDLLALELAGIKGGRLYAGSWSEWIRDPARPVATGD